MEVEAEGVEGVGLLGLEEREEETDALFEFERRDAARERPALGSVDGP
jgi:hypothetical protein